MRAEKSQREKEKGIISYLIYTLNYFMPNRYTVGPYWYLNDYQIILILFQRTFSSCRFATLNEDFFQVKLRRRNTLNFIYKLTVPFIHN